MRDIKTIIIHATASKEGVNLTVNQIRVDHMKWRGFRDIGYHYVILLDGSICSGRPIAEAGAHCAGHNDDSIGIAYVGGCDKNNKPKDTRTPEQKESLKILVKKLIKEYPTINKIAGHRDFSPDKNNDGIIDRREWIKACPSFDVSKEFAI